MINLVYGLIGFRKNKIAQLFDIHSFENRKKLKSDKIDNVLLVEDWYVLKI